MLRPPSHITGQPLVAIAVLVTAAVVAQQPAAAQVQIEGHVIEDQSGQPIEGVRVTLLSLDDRRLDVHYTDEHGLFDFWVRSRVAVKLRAERLGYRETMTPILYFDDHDFFRVEIRLDLDAVLLAPLEVVARSRLTTSPVLDGFEHRRTAGMGWYFTREDVERHRPARVTDLLAMVPGVELLSTGMGLRRVVSMGRRGGCQAQIWVDGFHITRPTVAGPAPFTVDDLVTPAAIEGIEVYRGISSVPAEFLSPEAVCGVVVIWTRRGG